MNHNAEYNSKTNTIDLLNGASVGEINTLTGVRLKADGGTSDGYHTFDELYEHRMYLFAVICNQNSDKAWKSLKHHDGTMYDEYFIVGVTTDEGDYTYHYHMDNWEHFKVKEIEFAPEWDGHVPSDITRLLSL